MIPTSPWDDLPTIDTAEQLEAFGRPDSLQVNGSARLVTDGPFFDDLVVRGHRPPFALLVDVEEVFFHCPKAFVRAHAWHPDRWQPEAARPYGHIAKALWRRDEDLAQIEARLAPEVLEAQLYPTGTHHGPEESA